MKTFQIVYFSSLGDLMSVMLKATTQEQAFKKFRKEHGYYTIKSITEVK